MSQVKCMHEFREQASDMGRARRQTRRLTQNSDGLQCTSKAGHIQGRYYTRSCEAQADGKPVWASYDRKAFGQSSQTKGRPVVLFTKPTKNSELLLRVKVQGSCW